MSWRPTPEDDEQAEIVRRALAKAVDASGWSRREVDRRVGWTENYLSQMLRNAADLKLVHVSAVLRVLGIEPADFYGTVFQRAEDEPSDTVILKTLTETMKRYEQQLKALQKRLDEAVPAETKGRRARA
jgi:transcriptional regulator with XRE-family HTH domain